MNQTTSRTAQEQLHSIKNGKLEDFNSNKKQMQQVITKCMHTKVFLVWSIFLSTATFFMIISGFTAFVDSSLLGIFRLLLSIPAIVSTVCVWKIYTSKKDILASSDLNGSKAFIIYMQVICILYSIVTCIASMLLMVLGDFLDSLIGNIGSISNRFNSIFGGHESSSSASGFGGFKLIIFLAGAILTFAIIEFAIALGHSKNRIKYLQTALDSGEYDPSCKMHKIRMYILGGFLVLLGLISFLFSFLDASVLFSAFQYIFTGGYIIVTILMLNNTHNEICNNINNRIEDDESKLNENKYYEIDATELNVEKIVEKSKICNKCGTKVTGKFCTNCGQRIEENYVCPNCGKEYKDEVRFCGECGYCFADTQEKSCPKCGTTKENNEKFCRECGYSFANT